MISNLKVHQPDVPKVARAKLASVPEPEPIAEKPLAPLQAWLRAELDAAQRAGRSESEACKYVAKRVGLSGPRLEQLLRARGTISEKTADAMVSKHGRYMLAEVYATAWKGKSPTEASVPRCARPGCSQPRSGLRRVKADRGWKNVPSLHCEEHRLQLEKVRAGLEADSKLMADNGGAQRRESKPRKNKRSPTCCNPHCWEPREPGERFCSDCVSAGFDEDMYA